MAFIIIYPGFYIQKLNIRVYIIQHFYPSIASLLPPPSPPPPPLPSDPVNCLGLQGITKFIHGIAIIHESQLHVKSTILAMPLISVLIIYMGPVSIHVKSYILGLYACKSFYPCLFKNSYAIKCFLYVGLNFHLGKRLP